MIGSHDSFTFLKSTKLIMNTISSFWRTQDHTIIEQYRAGVRYFDIRVKLEKNDIGYKWRVCHGLSSLDKVYSSLKSLCNYFENTLTGSLYRIILENNDGEEQFLKEIEGLPEKYPHISEIAIKSPWKYLYRMPNHPAFKSYYYEPWNTSADISTWSKILKYIKTISTIKKYAKSHNPEITQEMIDDKTTIYLMDYVCGF